MYDGRGRVVVEGRHTSRYSHTFLVGLERAEEDAEGRSTLVLECVRERHRVGGAAQRKARDAVGRLAHHYLRHRRKHNDTDANSSCSDADIDACARSVDVVVVVTSALGFEYYFILFVFEQLGWIR